MGGPMGGASSAPQPCMGIRCACRAAHAGLGSASRPRSWRLANILTGIGLTELRFEGESGSGPPEPHNASPSHQTPSSLRQVRPTFLDPLDLPSIDTVGRSVGRAIGRTDDRSVGRSVCLAGRRSPELVPCTRRFPLSVLCGRSVVFLQSCQRRR